MDKVFLDKDIKKFVSSEMLKFIVLHHFRNGKKYPYEIYMHFSSRKHPAMLNLSKSDFYNVISALERQGFIKAEKAKVDAGSRMHKYYAITGKGRATLSASRKVLRKATMEFIKFLRSEFNG